MPRPKKRPTSLPDAVKARAAQTHAPAPSPNQNRAILMTDPRDTPPECPQRPVKPNPAPSPIVHHPPNTADTEQPPPTSADPTDWYEQAIAYIPNSPSQRRGKVAVKMTDQGFELASQDADVLVHYEKPKAIAPTNDDPPPTLEPPEISPSVFPDLALSMVLWCAGFLCALLLVGIAIIGSDRPVIFMQPQLQGDLP